MKTGESAKLLGIDVGTVRNWIDHELMVDFFSPGARGEHGGTQRVLNESDILTLNTIRHLRASSITDWNDIFDYLQTGKREQEFPQNAISADPRTIPIPQAEQSARAMATLAERDAALQQVEDLRARVQELEQEKEELRERLSKEKEEIKETLMREIMELMLKIGRLEGRLESRDDNHR